MLIKIYPDNPNSREINRVADCLSQGGVVVIPTDSLYAFACSMRFKKSVEAIAQLKGYSLKKAKYSMMCCDLSQLSEYVRPMEKEVFALLKRCLPGPYTFILDANNEVPRNYQNANKTIGMRVPAHPVARAIVQALGCPLVVTSVRRLDEEQEEEYLTDPELIHEEFGRRVDMVVDGGLGDVVPSTIVDLSGGNMEIIRYGKGDIEL